MSKKIGLIILVVLALSLGACTRVASVASQATATKGNNFPKAVDTNGMKVLEEAGTQTAVALTGTPSTAATATPAPTNEATPLAGVEQTPVAMPSFTPVGQQAPAATDTPLPSPTPVVSVPQPTVVTTNPGTYVLKEGEFPYCIARRFNRDPNALLALNGLSSSQSYYAPGTSLKIPASGTWPGSRALKTHPTSYTVQYGDTIYKIACAFGDVDPANIIATNSLTSPYTLTVGAKINIP
jgi:LysM repeat protein